MKHLLPLIFLMLTQFVQAQDTLFFKNFNDMSLTDSETATVTVPTDNIPRIAGAIPFSSDGIDNSPAMAINLGQMVGLNVFGQLPERYYMYQVDLRKSVLDYDTVKTSFYIRGLVDYNLNYFLSFPKNPYFTVSYYYLDTLTKKEYMKSYSVRCQFLVNIQQGNDTRIFLYE